MCSTKQQAETGRSTRPLRKQREAGGERLPESGGEGAREVVRFPAEKDYTDSQSCLREALARGCGQVVLAGATGGRLDHLLCNLHLLEWVEGQGAHGYVVDGGNVAQILRPGVVQVPAQFRYFSLIPLDPVLAGVDIRGAKYPLQNATVRRDDSLCVSNEALGQAVEIRIAHGQAFLIFSK